jgi:branched-chain amino acid transport system substrate-binding protein
MKRFVLGIFIVFTMTGVAAAANPAPIKIGAVMSQTGNQAHSGVQALRAFTLLTDEVNAAGGIKGRQVEIIVGNTNSEPERTAAAAMKVTMEDKVLAIVGPDNASLATAAKEQVAEPEEIVIMSVTGSSPRLTADKPRWYFRGATPANYQTTALTEYLVTKRGLKTFAILCDAALLDQSDALVADLKKYDITPVAVESHKTGTTNFNGQLLSVRPHNPDVIFFIGYVTECISVIKQARDMGINAQIAGSTGIMYEELCTMGGPVTEGVLGTIGFTCNNPDPAVQTFCDTFKDKYGELPDHAAGQGYDQLALIFEAMRQKDLTFAPGDLAADRAKIRDWLENDAIGRQGLSGIIQYTPDDHTAYKAINVMVVKDGRWTVMEQ